jgi:DnaK suppressor protein
MLTKEQLAELREKLENELQEIKDRNNEKIHEMEENITADKFHGDEADQATYIEERNRILRLRDRDRKLLVKLEKTIQKMDEGNYGVCNSCGIDITFERLMMRPVAALCIECKLEQEEREERDRVIRR